MSILCTQCLLNLFSFYHPYLNSYMCYVYQYMYLCIYVHMNSIKYLIYNPTLPLLCIYIHTKSALCWPTILIPITPKVNLYTFIHKLIHTPIYRFIHTTYNIIYILIQPTSLYIHSYNLHHYIYTHTYAPN